MTDAGCWSPRSLIVGGSRGIGRATALRLATAGSAVAIGYHHDDARAKETAHEVTGLGGSAVLIRGDVAQDGPLLVDGAVSAFGGLDLLVVTAMPVITGRSGDVSPADFRRAMDVVVWGFHQTVVAARTYLARSGGSVIAVSSLGAWLYAGYYGALGPAKAAMESTVRYLAAELGPEGVRVNAVSPCLVNDLQHLAEAPDVVRFMEGTAKRTPLRRLATPDEIAGAILALASPACSFVTGEILKVDGGYSLMA
jgi:NAD(P)-dependent dehydrogenase (short-subunit alcohol dehydrogenase family)